MRETRGRLFRATMTTAAIAALMVVVAPAQPAFARNPLPFEMDGAFQQECLDAHNRYRARHGVPPLTTDQDIVAYAKSRATALTQGEGLSLGRQGLAGHGENLHWSGTSVPGRVGSCADAVTSWYDTIEHYDFATGEDTHDAGSFTQVVWKSTSRLGCARAAGQGPKWYETYIVCNYKEPGNYAGRFQENVPPPRR